MTQYAQPDIEDLTVSYLRTVAGVTSIVAVDDIATKLRSSWTAATPALRVRRLGGIATSDSNHLVRFRLQIDAFAEDEATAYSLAAAAELALRTMHEATHPGAVVTKYVSDLGITNTPDPDSDASRYLFGAAIYAHGIA